MDFFNDIFHNLALLEFYFLKMIYILLYIDFILSIFFQHSNILTRASHHWCLASNIVLVIMLRVIMGCCMLETLTHWGRATHICVGNLTIIGSDNGLSPGRRQAITWTNVGILLLGPLGTNFSEILTEIRTFSFKKIHLKMSSGKWRPFCLGLNVLTHWSQETHIGVNELGHHWFR